jgi:hypothetical protein
LWHEIGEHCMSQFSQSHPQRRAPRANLRETIPVTIQLENGRQLSAKLHQLSITGGLIEVATCLEERIWVELTLPLGFSIVHLTAEMMFPMRGANGYMQPFRITRIETEDLHKLDKEVAELLKQNVAPATRGHGAGFRPPHFYLESF